ncbi:MAG: ferredoxin--NADP reductase [Pirellulaceae bacterium]
MTTNEDDLPGPEEVQQLRAASYNATLIDRTDVHEDLALFRIKPDSGVPAFKPGQYLTLGLGYWEDRVSHSQKEHLKPRQLRKVVKRAYSIACPMLDSQGEIAPCSRLDYFEFYITLVREAESPPALTPRLFQLKADDRLFAASRIVGNYVLDGVEDDDNVVFFGTGTGEAPHNAMATELLSRGHRGRIVTATCVRMRRDLAYMETQLKLAELYPNYKYLHFTTREIENTDPRLAGYVGKQHLQDVVKSGEFERSAEMKLDPQTTHVFLCGNPAMIGYHVPGTPELKTPGMLQILKRLGFHDHGSEGPGQIRFEKYW